MPACAERYAGGMRRLFPLLACVSFGFGCADAPPQGAAFACSGTLCPERYVCRQGYCFPLGGDGGCVPKDCTEDLSCGDVPDGCGAMLQCGGCASPKTCGGGGVANTCGCAGETSAELCAQATYGCGVLTKADRCGVVRTVQCGGCGVGLACIATAATSDCLGCAPETTAGFCARLGATCGTVNAIDNCGAVRSASCGPCAGCAPDGGACCLQRAQPCSADGECCDGRSCFNGRCERLDGGN